MKKILFYILLLILMLMIFSRVEASSFIFTPDVITIQAGKTFSLPVVVDPKDINQYTVRLAVSFSPELLEVTSFTFGDNWLAISQPGYDSVNNKKGELIKTAGFPKGFSSPVSFGIITFRAKGVGNGTITVQEASFILDRESKSTLESRPQVRVIITENIAPKESLVEPLQNLPIEETNLFDISLVPQVETLSAGLVSRVAPGEFLPLSVKLLNFGSQKEVDVKIFYQITDQIGNIIYNMEETVAVSTTASFIKTIQIPFETIPGRYIAKSSIVYQDQVVPATTEFPFTVERKILGLFQSDFYLYGGITFLVSLIMLILGRIWVKRRRLARLSLIDYSDIPRDKRIFYEILSDTITQMRTRVGDEALLIARNIDGLKIDKETGRVLDISGPPAKIIATLVSEYEKSLGKNVSFFFRKS